MHPVEDTLEAHLSRHTVRRRTIYHVVLLALVTAAGLMPVIRVGVSIQGDGIVRPVVEKHEVRAIASGVVEGVRVRQHEMVEAGAELLRLAPEPATARRSVVAAQLADVEAAEHDLELLVGEEVNLPRGVLLTNQHRAEHARFLAEREEITLRVEQANRELDRARRLADTGLLPRREAEEWGDRLAMAEAERASFDRLYQGDWQRRFSELRLQARDLRRRLVEADEEVERLSLRAPISGSLEELAPVSPGSFVQAGQVIASISPREALIAEVFVTPKDVGLLRADLPARLLIDAFNYNDWGFVTGRIVEISDDFILVGQAPRFRVTVEMDDTSLVLPNGARADVRKGMTLRARFMIADRSLWQLLRDDINGWVNPLIDPIQGRRR
jgi:membrane fusion protein, peptide pheromone/bacteriocin exporter